jgi:hypothetical protein
VAILETILREEVGHVAIGSRWFDWCCAREGVEPGETFLQLLREVARGALRGPFNLEARRAAGFDDAEMHSWRRSPRVPDREAGMRRKSIADAAGAGAGCWRPAAAGRGGEGAVELARGPGQGGGDAADYEAARTAGNPRGGRGRGRQLREKYPDSSAAHELEPRWSDVRKARRRARDARLRGCGTTRPTRSAGHAALRLDLQPHRDLGDDQPAPCPDAQLVLRDHPEWGRSAYLLLAQSKFSCGKPCTLQLAFDDARAGNLAGQAGRLRQGPALFIEDEPRFIEGAARREASAAWCCRRAAAASARWCSKSAAIARALRQT